MSKLYEKLETCLASVRQKTDFKPEVALILGSGLGDYADEIKIETTKAGTADYSIQLVQPNIPAQQAATYKLTFDASADAERTMKVDGRICPGSFL